MRAGWHVGARTNSSACRRPAPAAPQPGGGAHARPGHPPLLDVLAAPLGVGPRRVAAAEQRGTSVSGWRRPPQAHSSRRRAARRRQAVAGGARAGRATHVSLVGMFSGLGPGQRHICQEGYGMKGSGAQVHSEVAPVMYFRRVGVPLVRPHALTLVGRWHRGERERGVGGGGGGWRGQHREGNTGQQRGRAASSRQQRAVGGQRPAWTVAHSDGPSGRGGVAVAPAQDAGGVGEDGVGRAHAVLLGAAAEGLRVGGGGALQPGLRDQRVGDLALRAADCGQGMGWGVWQGGQAALGRARAAAAASHTAGSKGRDRRRRARRRAPWAVARSRIGSRRAPRQVIMVRCTEGSVGRG